MSQVPGRCRDHTGELIAMELIQKILTDKGKSPLLDPEWLRRMKAEYAASGRVRAEDIFRVVGDPTKYVDLGKPRS